MAGPRIKLSSSNVGVKKGAFGVINTTKIDLNTKVVAKFKDPNSALSRYVNERRKETSVIARTFYAGMLRTVEYILKDPSGATNGQLKSKPLNRRTVNLQRSIKMDVVNSATQSQYQKVILPLESGRTTQTSWNELPSDYVAVFDPSKEKDGSPQQIIAQAAKGQYRDPLRRWKGLPLSPMIWRKTGRTYKAYRAQLAKDWATVGASKRYGLNKPARILKKAGNGREISTTSFDIIYPTLGSAAMNRILRESFASGSPKRYGVRTEVLGKNAGPNGGPTGVERMAYPEFKRPMLARFAAAAGRANRQALKNYLKGLK